MKKLMGAIALLSFITLIGLAGVLETDLLNFTQYIILSFIDLTVFAISLFITSKEEQ